jgi:hypothetical protein
MKALEVLSTPPHIHTLSPLSFTMTTLIMKQEHSMLTLEKSSLEEALAELDATLTASSSKLERTKRNKIADRLNQINSKLRQLNAVFDKETAEIAAKEATAAAAREEAARKKAEAEAERRARLPPEISLSCRDCSESFPFSGDDQERFAENGWTHPIRCPDCRQARKDAREQNNGSETTEQRRPALPALTISCRDCKISFDFSGAAQKRFAKMGYEMPVRCDDCRQKKKDSAPKPILINCSGCHADFTFSIGAQKHFAEMSWGAPKICADCRKVKKAKAKAKA